MRAAGLLLLRLLDLRRVEQGRDDRRRADADGNAGLAGKLAECAVVVEANHGREALGRETFGLTGGNHAVRVRRISDDGNARIDIWITDHGKGFNIGEARSRRQKLGAVHKRGWGLQIIEAHMDEVGISTRDDGTTIHMVKYGKRS